MSNYSTFRAWLKRRRLERGITQEELGELVGYAGQTITKIEGGQRRPSPQLALKLAQVLQIAPDDQPAWMAAALGTAETAPATAVAARSEEVPLRPPTPSLGLPTYMTPLVGREQEQADLAALLDRPDCRLVTLLGPGGVGKTRLAIETARSVPSFPDGIAFVALAPLGAPTLIVPAIGDALGFAFSGNTDLFAQLVFYLRDRHILLILDNLEHLLDAEGSTGDLLERLLHQAPSVSVLATSRERLRLAGEWVLEIQGLAVPHPATATPVETPALRLFAEHAARVDRTFRLTPENVGAVVTICRQVDGLPLGIELAAAWLRLLSLDEIVAELARGLDSAQLAPRSMPARHHSLRAVVDHSWQLLRPEERQALRRLAVFGGGCTREAALEVADAQIQMLASLVDKSLLRRAEGGRYDLHEVIRQYADARLQEDGAEWTAIRQRHAAYFLRFAADRDDRVRGADQVAALAELNAEIDNIRAAWIWGAAHGPLDELEHAGEVMQWFFEFRGWLQEGAAFFGQAIERVNLRKATIATAADRHALGRLLGHYAYRSVRASAFAHARAALAESYALLADGGDPAGLARTLYYQGAGLYWGGNYAEARRVLDESLALTATTDDPHTPAMTLTTASNVAFALGEHHEAERLFRAALARWRAVGNPRGMVWCISSCSDVLASLGKYEEAQQLLRESLAISHSTGDRYGSMVTLYHLGRVAFLQGNIEQALSLFNEVLPLLRNLGNQEYPQALNIQGAALWQSGATDEARRAYRAGLAAALDLRAAPEALQALSGLAACLAHDGQHAAALGLAARVLADPASQEPARHSARETQRVARAQLADDEAARVEAQASTRPLDAFLADLAA